MTDPQHARAIRRLAGNDDVASIRRNQRRSERADLQVGRRQQAHAAQWLLDSFSPQLTQSDECTRGDPDGEDGELTTRPPGRFVEQASGSRVVA